MTSYYVKFSPIPWPICNLASNVASLENVHPKAHLITDRLHHSTDLNGGVKTGEMSLELLT